MEVNYYVNLTNGIEAIPALCDVVGTGYKFIRIQSTSCERHMWDKLIQDLDYDFLMNLALGKRCVVVDFGARKKVPRAVYQGLEFVRYVLYRRWLDKEYQTNINRHNNKNIINNCNSYFNQCYKNLEDKTKKKLDYFKPYLNTDEIKLCSVCGSTVHDGDKEFYKNILLGGKVE